jgi:hypothetical protein
MTKNGRLRWFKVIDAGYGSIFGGYKKLHAVNLALARLLLMTRCAYRQSQNL